MAVTSEFRPTKTEWEEMAISMYKKLLYEIPTEKDFVMPERYQYFMDEFCESIGVAKSPKVFNRLFYGFMNFAIKYLDPAE